MGHPNPGDRSLAATIASNTKWARLRRHERRAETTPARTAFDARFDKQVDPDGLLPPDERALLAANARSAYFARLALKSAQARRRNRQAQAERAPREEAT